MKYVKSICAAGLILAGCGPGSEMYVLLPLVPVGMAIDAVQTSGSITQPIQVVNASGRVVAGPRNQDTKPMQVIQTSPTVVTCRGAGTTDAPRRGVRRVNLLCDNGTSAEATLSENLTVGNVFNFTLRERQRDVAVCRGNYFKSGSKDGPFIVRCVDIEREWVDFNRTRKEEIEVRPRLGAAEVTETGGTSQITVWLQP